MKKALIGLLVLALTSLFVLFLISNNNQPEHYPVEETQIKTQEKNSKIEDLTLKNALNLYAQKKAEGTDFSNGPCLGQIAQNWVLDIAHSPRLPMDDEDKNQCADILEGKTEHFIELDPEGNLIRTQ